MIFPNIHNLSREIATLSFITCSVKISLSEIRKIKTIPDNPIGTDRLSSLAVLPVAWEIKVDPYNVLDVSLPNHAGYYS